ncbi:MAG: Ig-like domain-containing protein [Candidatus Heimdallarchaeaceae archaeon]
MMDLRHIFLYNILPKKRIIIAFIGFLISSTIITGGAILMNSIIVATNSYMGESDDVLVISNPLASTPYTSILPLELADTIRKITGVLEVSPEVMTAAVYKDTAVYFRGVDANIFWKFIDVDYVEGSSLEGNETYEVAVGINFARRNNLEVGDYLSIFSTRSSSVLELKVKAIFSTNTILDDEIIASLWIGQFFTFESFNLITHIRVKVDLNVVPSKEYIRDLVLNKYSLKTTIRTPDNLERINTTVYVRTTKGNNIKEELLFNSNQTEFILPFGEYEVQAEIEGIFSEPTNILLSKNTSIVLFVNYIEKEVKLRVITDENEPIEGASVEVHTDTDTAIIQQKKSYFGITDENGEVTLTLANGTYIAEISYSTYYKNIQFSTNLGDFFVVELIKRHPHLSIRNYENYSTIIGTEINVSLSVSSGYNVYFYFDGNTLNTREYYRSLVGYSSTNGILITLEEGAHSLTVYAYNQDYIGSGDKSKNYKEVTLFFNLQYSFPSEYVFVNAMNGSQIEPSSNLFINSSLYFSRNLTYSWDGERERFVTNTYIRAPEEQGIHKLILTGSSLEEKHEWVYFFVVKEAPEKIGAIGINETNVLKVGKKIQVWYDRATSLAYYNWDGGTSKLIPLTGKIGTGGLTEGNHTLNVVIQIGIYWFSKSFQVILDNSPPNITLSAINGTIIESGSFISYWSNESLSMFEFSWDALPYSRTFSENIPIPLKNGNHTLLLKARDKAGNTIIKNYTFIVENYSGINPIDFYLLNEYDGKINQSYIDIKVFSNNEYFLIEYEIQGEKNLSGNLYDFKRVYLHPGSYKLIIKFWLNIFEQRIRTWNFEVEKGYNTSFIDPITLNNSANTDIRLFFPYFDCNFTLSGNNSIYLSDGIYSTVIENMTTFEHIELTFTIDTKKPFITIISPRIGQNETLVPLELTTDAVDISFRLDGEKELYIYDKMYLLDYDLDGKHKITFYLTDSFYNERVYAYFFFIGLNYVNISLNFYTIFGKFVYPIANLSFEVQSAFNNSRNTLTTNSEGNANFDVFFGKFQVNFVFSSKSYNFLLDTSLGLEQSIYLGLLNVSFSIFDKYSNEPIAYQYLTIRDYFGKRIDMVKTNNLGTVNLFIATGDYIAYFRREEGDIAVPFQVYTINQSITFKINSYKHQVIFNFQFDNGSKVFNLPVVFSTLIEGNFSANTGHYSTITLWISYGYVNITVYLKTGEILTFRRSFEPGKETITIIISSDIDEQWLKIPFKPVAGFDFIVSLSLEYMDYYLKGSLLFTYTLAYAEVILILLVVLSNLHTILNNVYIESRRETMIVRMIGGTRLHSIIALFSRLSLVAIIAAFIGYGIGLLVLKLLAAANQTVFFGHTFKPAGSGIIFLLNLSLIIFASLISSIIISRKALKEKKVTVTKRR